jgi:hypothetical protein
MDALKAGAAVAFVLAGLVVVIFLASFLIVGTAYVSTTVLPYLSVIVVIGCIICIVILLPLSIFKKTPVVAMWGFFLLSFLYGLDVWLLGLMVTYHLWGIAGVLIGLVISGVGVVPLGIVAAALHGLWQPVGELVQGVVITFLAYFYAVRLARKIDEASRLERLARGL